LTIMNTCSLPEKIRDPVSKNALVDTLLKKGYQMISPYTFEMA